MSNTYYQLQYKSNNCSGHFHIYDLYDSITWTWMLIYETGFIFPQSTSVVKTKLGCLCFKKFICRWRWGYFLNIHTQMSKVYDFHMPATIIVSPWRLGIKTTICAGFVGLRVTLLHATIQLWTSDNGFFFFLLGKSDERLYQVLLGFPVNGV